jgi:hypothetical protein
MSLIKQIETDLKEKIELLKIKTNEQPLSQVYNWIQRNSKSMLYDALFYHIPDAKKSNQISNILIQFVDILEKTLFDTFFISEYREYAERIRSYIIHSKYLCEVFFNQLSFKSSILFYIKAFSNVLIKIEIGVFLSKYLPIDHPIYGLIDNSREELRKKKEEKEKEIKELFPKSDVKCKKCGKTEVSFTSFQRRSIDEPPDEFFYCKICDITFKHV